MPASSEDFRLFRRQFMEDLANGTLMTPRRIAELDQKNALAVARLIDQSEKSLRANNMPTEFRGSEIGAYLRET